MSKVLKTLIFAALAIVLLVLLVFQLSELFSLQKIANNEKEPNITQNQPTPTASPTITVTATPASKFKTIKLFVKNYKTDPNVIDCKADDFVEREIPNSPEYLTDAVNELFNLGVSASEKAEGLRNLYTDDTKSAENLKLVNISLVGKTAQVTLKDPDDFTSGGSCRSGILLSALERTLKQFAGVESVQIEPQGRFFQP